MKMIFKMILLLSILIPLLAKGDAMEKSLMKLKVESPIPNVHAINLI